MKTFEKQITVNSSHTDQLNHVNNVTYVQWVNDIAWDHWSRVTKEEWERNYFWVMVNHQIAYKGQAFEGDDITIRTSFDATGTIKSDRRVEFIKKGKIIAESITTWCLIDRQTKELLRLPADIKALIEAD